MKDVLGNLKDVGRRALPPPLKDWLWRQYQTRLVAPAPGRVRFGHLRRLTPLSQDYGYDRGRPVDRYYIEAFLREHASNVQGRVLEVLNNDYTKAFGGTKVAVSDVLHAKEGNPVATIVGDLSDAPQIPDDTFDCIIFTQTLLLIYDVKAALATLHRILKPGGVLLMTVSGISPHILGEGEHPWNQYWNFSEASVSALLNEMFAPEQLAVASYGNVFSATAFLYGLAAEELRQGELEAHDPRYQVIISARAVKET